MKRYAITNDIQLGDDMVANPGDYDTSELLYVFVDGVEVVCAAYANDVASARDVLRDWLADTANEASLDSSLSTYVVGRPKFSTVALLHHARDRNDLTSGHWVVPPA
jgi:hypothetical protein